MPRKKDQRFNVRPSTKNQIYLQRLGLIDQHGRSKAARDESLTTINEFVNECISIVCESGMHSRNSIASGEELRLAWNAYNVVKIGDQINKLVDEREKLRESMPSEWTVTNGKVKVWKQ